MFQQFAPKANIPPSAKNRHWIAKMTTMERKPAWGPSSAVSIMPPHRWPEEPVPGMV